jgi:protein daughter of sevenless
LTDDQPNSPKRNNTSNVPIQVPTQNAPKHGKAVAGSIHSSPSDSEGGSTDEDWTEPKVGDRKTRPSDSSMENESIAITAVQSYMKMTGNPIPLPPKRMSLVLEKKQEASDTEENASPLMPIGPRDSSSCVDERYDFPRSYNVQGFTGSHINIGTSESMVSIHGDSLMTSTPNLIHSSVSTLDRSQLNFYSNAAPRENNIFRFDFSSNTPAPEVNRTLKPKKQKNGHGLISIQNAPTVDRKLKPGTMSKVSEIILVFTIHHFTTHSVLASTRDWYKFFKTTRS